MICHLHEVGAPGATALAIVDFGDPVHARCSRQTFASFDAQGLCGEEVVEACSRNSSRTRLGHLDRQRSQACFKPSDVTSCQSTLPTLLGQRLRLIL